ncbi:FAD-binding monooxygenase [Kineosporia sp. NBRC 101731]|nr:FAD-binding monooxygenase [Kineosporia sp. NBRC 101731]
MAGLLAAAALHATFDEVMVLDRDIFPDEPGTRKGVPQGGHVHGLLARGRAALDELFEGLSAELIDQGAPVFDVQDDMQWWVDGRPLARGASGMFALVPSRSLLEFAVRRRVAALPGVRFLTDHTVTGLLATPDGARCDGVQFTDGRGPGSVEGADLVVDATGRSARGRLWLERLGFPQAPQQRIETQVTYVTRRYRREPHDLDGLAGLSIGAYPGSTRSAFALAQEDDTWIVTITGRFGAVPPTDDAGMLDWVAHLDSPGIADIIRDAVPLSSPVKMRYPASTRVRYDRMDRFPAGLLIVGDALCSFNPVYGQGMTVAALEALLLKRLLEEGAKELSTEFFLAAEALIDVPWSTVAATDLQFAETTGDRSGLDPERVTYLAHLRRAAVQDPELAGAFLRVAQLIDPPAALFAPEIARRVEVAA